MDEMVGLEFALDSEENENYFFVFWERGLEIMVPLQALMHIHHSLDFPMHNMPC